MLKNKTLINILKSNEIENYNKIIRKKKKKPIHGSVNFYVFLAGHE